MRTQTSSGLSAETQSPPQIKILAIEWDADVLSLYESYLKKRGYNVLTAQSAFEGMGLLNANGGDVVLIITALVLPDMTGDEFLEWLVATNRNVPVIIASGASRILTVAKQKAGFPLAAITKPFHMEELQELIEVLLSANWRKEISCDVKVH